jgi:hypothetical protein
VIAGSGLAAVGLAALLVAGLLALHGRGNSPGPNHSLAAVGTKTATASAHKSPGASLRSKTSPSPKPNPTPAVDACLVGTWTVVADDLLNNINNAQVQFTFTGHGGYITFRADGSGFEEFAPETLTAVINGNTWTDVFQGSVTMHVDTRGGDMLFSDVLPSKNALQTLYENGSYNNATPVTLEPGPLRYTCGGNTLRTFANDGSSVLTRKLPSRRPA